MTIEEVIRHCEEVAESEEQKYKEWKGDYSHLKKIDSCLECASEHRQLAEWLRELKAYKDFEDKGYIMCRFEVAQDDRHRTTKMVLDFSTKKLFDNIVEVNADDNN